ncbi:Dyp-type peroxidase [Mycolicibacterium sp. 624]|uniref:Dyp-type peroxidase n=1 Tax=Mycolicibacterium sp. 624 TaxID=3156314 RepID=UPI0033986CCB
MTTRDTPVTLELDDIQNGALHPRPSPYVGAYILLRIEDRRAGRELLRRLIPFLADATSPMDPSHQAWVTAALSYQGLKALGVPQDTLDSFPLPFQQGMAARAAQLGDVGESAPENWEKPLGTPDVHIGLSALSPDAAGLKRVLAPAREAIEELSGVTTIWSLDCYALPTETEAFGFRDGISHPAIEGSGIPGSNPQEQPLKPGEFLLGYENERHEVSAMPRPEVLGKNGTYVVFRKLHQRVAAFRQYLKANSSTAEEEELLGAKMMGRWQSGAPLALCPMHDDPGLGADPKRNNDFLFKEDDPQGMKTPPGSHIRRMNPRDSDISGFMRFHRMIRRGTSYGPLLPPGVIEDDGAERGLAFVFIGASLERQFEFVQQEWINKGQFFHGPPDVKDPIAGANNGTGSFTIPRQPIRRRLQGLPAFVVTRGGEYFFAPGLRAMRWLAELDT